MSSYIIAGSADSIDTAYVHNSWSSVKKLQEELRLNIKILILELLLSILQNGNNISSKSVEFTASLINPIQLFTLLMEKLLAIKMPLSIVHLNILDYHNSCW